MTLNEQYAKHLADGNTNACIAMEEKYGLYGYPPELVSVGLAAIEAGHAPEDAIYAVEGVIGIPATPPAPGTEGE